MDAELREFVRERAGQRCEYCRLPQTFSELRFHIEHVIPRQHQGGDTADNLALACPACNLHKGTNLTGVEPDTGQVISLFHPRRDRWEEHFVFEGVRIVGRTPKGRTTAWLLDVNDATSLRIRVVLRALGELD